VGCGAPPQSCSLWGDAAAAAALLPPVLPPPPPQPLAEADSGQAAPPPVVWSDDPRSCSSESLQTCEQVMYQSAQSPPLRGSRCRLSMLLQATSSQSPTDRMRDSERDADAARCCSGSSKQHNGLHVWGLCSAAGAGTPDLGHKSIVTASATGSVLLLLPWSAKDVCTTTSETDYTPLQQLPM